MSDDSRKRAEARRDQVDLVYLTEQEVAEIYDMEPELWRAWVQTIGVNGAELHFDAQGRISLLLTPADEVGKDVPLSAALVGLRLQFRSEIPNEDIAKAVAELFPGKITLTQGEIYYLASILKERLKS